MEGEDQIGVVQDGTGRAVGAARGVTGVTGVTEVTEVTGMKVNVICEAVEVI